MKTLEWKRDHASVALGGSSLDLHGHERQVYHEACQKHNERELKMHVCDEGAERELEE
jgi:hypothetical protein